MKSPVRLLRAAARQVVPVRWRPVRYLADAVVKASGGRVMAGPFRGMRYIDEAYCSALTPKYLGVYERELHPVVERACGVAVDRVVDIGAAEGYYAVGFAYRRSDVPVVAFEMDAAAREACRELARRNGLTATVTVEGTCDPDALARVTAGGTSLVVCDCEGAEDFSDPNRVPGLERAYILVETHEFITAGVSARLVDRFAATHRVEVVWHEDRRRADFPLTDWYIRRLQDIDVLAVIDEARPERMRWLWMEPVAPSPGGG